MPNSQLLVASYRNRTDAETASNFLISSGIDRKAISFIGKDCVTTEEVSGFYKTNDHIRYWGRQPAIWDQDVPAASFHLPEIGPLLVTGPLAQSIVNVLKSAIHGSGPGGDRSSDGRCTRSQDAPHLVIVETYSIPNRFFGARKRTSPLCREYRAKIRE